MQAKKVQDPKSGKSRLNIHCTILEGNSIGSNHKLEKRALKWNEKLMIWRTKMQAKKVQDQKVASQG